MPSEHHGPQQRSGGGTPQGRCSACPRYPPRCSWLGGHCSTSPAPAEPPSNAAQRSMGPRLATSPRETASSPAVLEHLMDPVTWLTPAQVPPRQPRPRGVLVEVRPLRLAPCTRSEMLGIPHKNLPFVTRAEGEKSSQAVPCPQNPCWTSLCKPTPKQGSPYKPEQACPWIVTSTRLGLLRL